MICPDCNTQNEDFRFRCKNCKSFLKRSTPQTASPRAENSGFDNVSIPPRNKREAIPTLPQRDFLRDLRSETSLRHLVEENLREHRRTTTAPVSETPVASAEQTEPTPVDHITDAPTPEIIKRTPEPEVIVSEPPKQREPLITETVSSETSRFDYRRMVLIGALTLGIVGSAFGTFFLYENYKIERSGAEASILFSQAESEYGQQNYSQSLILFDELLSTYPESEYAPLARMRAESIREGLRQADEESRFRQEQLVALNNLGNQAYDDERLLEPESDNVLFYVQEILRIDSMNLGAQELTNRMLQHYDNVASRALDLKKYNRARQQYKNMLIVQPNDAYAQRQLENIKKIILAERQKAGKPAKKNRQPKPQLAELNSDEAIQTSLANRIEQLRLERQAYLSQVNTDNAPLASAELTATERHAADAVSEIQSPVKEIASPGKLTASELDIAHDLSSLLYDAPDKTWAPIKRHLQNDVQILVEDQNSLILFHRSIRDSLIIARENLPFCDIYAATEQKRGGNPYRVWVATEAFWNNPVKLARAWELFFTKPFENEIRPPRVN